YGTGHSEFIVGKALASHRGQVVIATKFGFDVNEAKKHVTRYSKDAEVLLNLRRDCEDSLRRLNMDYIDLYQLHVWDYPMELADSLVDALETLVQEGKI
ncbi:MAG TPA: aldo/keto reductase, partial [Aggregatilineales bacterium]|nr:aldo/keto reductase [Aggregatilineales bacterium]